MSKVNFEQMYFCKGENFLRTIPIGYCGETLSLLDFLRILFPDYEDEHIRNNFSNFSEKGVLDYIYLNGGKRLEKVKSK